MSDGVMIAYLPTDGSWCLQPDPHMTLVYCGTTDLYKSDAFNGLAKDALLVAWSGGSFALDVTGIEQYGEGFEQVDVLELMPTPQLLMARRMVKDWNKSQYTEFKPHATVGPVGSVSALKTVPTRLVFDRLGVFFGDQKLEFNLNFGY